MRTTLKTASTARRTPDANGEVVGQLPYKTPVNVIGRTEDNKWVAVLTPDMKKGWLPSSVLTFAIQSNMQNLPAISGQAENAPVPLLH